MSNFEYKPARGDKPSKGPLYQEALRLYLESESPNLVTIAEQVGLKPDALISLADRQSWAKKRVLIQRDFSAERAAASEKVDQIVVESTVKHVSSYVKAYEAMAEKAAALPIQGENDAHTAKLVHQKAGLMKDITEGVQMLADLALSVGMAKGEKREEAIMGRLDHAKLVQLNLVIAQAGGEAAKQVLED